MTDLHERLTSRRGVRIEGARPDGVLLVNVGDRQMVLVNVVDGVRTRALDADVADAFGPFCPFEATKPSDDLRTRVSSVLSTAMATVPPEQVGSTTFDHRDTPDGPTRQDFAEMLTVIGRADVLPEMQSFADDPGFLMECLTAIVPALGSAGLVVDNPSTFCSLLHMQRTGLMPRGAQAHEMPQTLPVAAPPMPPPIHGMAPMPTAIPSDNNYSDVVPPETKELNFPPAVAAAAPPVAAAVAPPICQPAPVAPVAAVAPVAPGAPVAAVAPVAPAVKTIGKPNKAAKLARMAHTAQGKAHVPPPQ